VDSQFRCGRPVASFVGNVAPFDNLDTGQGTLMTYTTHTLTLTQETRLWAYKTTTRMSTLPFHEKSAAAQFSFIFIILIQITTPARPHAPAKGSFHSLSFHSLSFSFHVISICFVKQNFHLVGWKLEVSKLSKSELNLVDSSLLYCRTPRHLVISRTHVSLVTSSS